MNPVVTSSLSDAFKFGAQNHPETVVRFDTASPLAPELGTAVDLATLDALVDDLAAGLRSLDLVGGDRVVIAKRNHFDYQLLAAAAVRAGCIPVLLASSVPPDQVDTVIERADPSLVISDRVTVAKWRADTEELNELNDLGWGRTVLVDRDQIRANGFRFRSTFRPIDSAQIVTHTSGTTGIPKLVEHSIHSIGMRAKPQYSKIPVLGFKRRDRVAMCITWNHARAVDGLVALLHAGSSLLALGDPADLHATGKLLDDFRPTIVESMPNLYILWEQLPRQFPRAFESVRTYIGAFDAIHPRTVRAMLAASRCRTATWAQAYGQSEVGGITMDLYTRRSVRSNGAQLRSMGWPMPRETAARVVDERGDVVSPGTPGAIEVKTRGRALRYVGQESLHAKRIRGEWWTMGDVGMQTRTGRLILLDRDIDEVVGVSSCLGAEDLLMDRLPEATEIVIVADETSRRPIVALSTFGDVPPDLQRWANACGAIGVNLPDPHHLQWNAIPRTGTLKVRRVELAILLAQRENTTAAAPPPSNRFSGVVAPPDAA